MEDALKFFLIGLGTGAVYALAALGIVLVYRGSGVVNFAHGAMALIGAATFVELRESLTTPGAIASGVAITMVIGALVHLVIMRPMRHASPLARIIATLGLLTLLQQAAGLRYGNEIKFVAGIFPSGSFEVTSDVAVGQDRMYMLLTAVVITAVLWGVYRYTRFGMATSAVAENQRAAAALGHSPDVIATVNWAVGAGLAAVAGILITPLTGLSHVQLTLLVIPTLAAALVGGFRSFPLTLAGALAIGITEGEMARYVQTPGWSSSVPFILIIVVLVVRGQGLPLRSHVMERLPRLGPGRYDVGLGALAVVLGCVSVFLFSVNWAEAAITTLSLGIVCLSLVVVTGYCGQLSLAQFALAGVGAFVAGRLADVHDLPFLVALAAGVLVAIPVGVAVGLPALRTRGVNLAVVTIGLALAIEKLVFSNPDFTGGLDGTNLPAPSVAGIDVLSIRHPERYALVCIAAFVVLGVVVANLRRGRAGRRLLAVRANERAAAALGISVVGAKLYAFGLSAAIAAVGGILLAYRGTSVQYQQYNVLESINVVVRTVVGGVGFVVGPFVGASLGPGALAEQTISHVWELERYLDFIAGVLAVTVMMHNPDGLAPRMIRQYLSLFRRLRWPYRPLRADIAVGETGSHERVTPGTLAVENLSVRFGGVVALENVSLAVRPGEVVGLIGPNGAGKTTLIDAVSGINRSYRGTVSLNGRALERRSAGRRARAGLGRSFQALELFEDMTVGDNLRTASETRDPLAYLSAELDYNEMLALGFGLTESAKLANGSGLEPVHNAGSGTRAYWTNSAPLGLRGFLLRPFPQRSKAY